MTRPTTTYSSYLKLDELLSLQEPLSEGPEHDELLFIVIHQVYELWFKVILHELDQLQTLMAEDDLPRAGHGLNRILKVLKTCVAQIDILETMTPLEFLSFRDRLASASGFQSGQFRELEFALGYKRPRLLEAWEPDDPVRRRLEKRLASPSLWDGFLGLLSRQGVALGSARSRDVTRPVEPSPALQERLLDVYWTRPDLAVLCERLVDLDEGLQQWRYRHVKMVERTIGNKPGTGGSSGVAYLRQTLHRPLFPDLWAIRTDFRGELGTEP